MDVQLQRLEIGEGERIGEERAVTGGESRDDLLKTWMIEGRPSGRTNVKPEIIIGGEGV